MLDYLVIGTGRCGTGYIYKLFNKAGIPTTHEGYFGPGGPVGNRLRNQKHRVECSWLAVPYLNEPWFPDTKIIHIVRQPIKVINSLLSIGFFEQERRVKYKNFAYKHLDGLSDKDNSIDKAVYYFIKWNWLCYNRKDYLHRIEDDPKILLEYVGGSTNNIYSDKTYNSYNRHKYKEIKLTIDDIGKYKNEFIWISEVLGYGKET